MIEIDFICVVKNEEKYISDLIQSIIESAPHFLKWNLIIINDHSSDNTLKILESWRQKHENIYIYNNKFLGKVEGTILGLQKSKSNWIKFIDGDDFLNLSELKKIDFNCDAFAHDYFIINDKKKYINRISRTITNRREWIYELRSIPKAMFFLKRDLIDNIELFHDCIFEDLFINVQVVNNSQKLKIINKPIYYYRQHSNNYYGSNFFGNKRKVELLSKRLLNTIDVVQRYNSSIILNPHIKLYSKILANGINFKVFKLIRSPRLFLKAIYYRTIIYFPKN